MDFLKDLISTRGAQLIARYGATGLIALGTRLAINISPENANATAETIGAFVVAGVLVAIDHFSHKQQAEK